MGQLILYIKRTLSIRYYCLMFANNLFLIKIEMKHILCMRNKFIFPSVECIKPRWTLVTATRVCLIFCHGLIAVCVGHAALHGEYCCYREEEVDQTWASDPSLACLVVLKSCWLLAWKGFNAFQEQFYFEYKDQNWPMIKNVWLKIINVDRRWNLWQKFA